MSKLKTPREKKLASLALDRRNVYGENDKASRKRIPKAKRESHQELRRAANQPLHKLVGKVSDEMADIVETSVTDSLIEKDRKGFKKSPDAPLGNYLKGRKSKAWPDTKHGKQLTNHLIKF